jgi:CubicO group peptidase (beta-lactamase class C family)
MAETNIIQRSDLRAENLLSAKVVKSPLSMSAFSEQGLFRHKKLQIMELLQGTFTFSGITKLANLELTENSDVYQFEKRTRPAAFTEKRRILPKMTVPFVLYKDKIIPLNGQLQITEHPHWDFIIGTGNIWQEEEDKQFSRIAMPFSLVEKNQNCVHNGVLSFLINQQKQTSHFYYQISSETCLYYKADLWGKGEVIYQDTVKSNYPEARSIDTDLTIQQYENEINKRLLSFPIEALTEKKITLQLSNIAMSETIKPTDMSSFGVIYNGQHYSSTCQTRYGDYPFCQQLVLPSYSTAKSIFAGLSMLYLAKEHPTIFDEKVSDWVEECQGSEQWQGVTFSHLLNMATGNYHSIGHSVDEAAEHSQQFFKATSHQDKIFYSCHQFPHKSTPGSTFVYHTADTYLLGTALNAFIKHQSSMIGKNQKTDLFELIFKQQLWPELHLSQIAYSTRRTSDEQQQPFAGYGLFFTQNDIAKLSQFLMNEAVESSKLLEKTKLGDLLARNKSEKDMHSQYPFIHYINGFWKRNVTLLLQCKKETWLPYMMGYGGINIVLAKENLQYYYFSDSANYLWQDAIKELDKLTPLCRQ